MAHSLNHQPEKNLDTGKLEATASEFAVDSRSPLPDGYGDNRIVVMARDPFWFFAYWEITPERADQIRAAHGAECWERASLVLRVYDLGDSHQTPMDSAPFFDVPVPPFSRQQYVQVPHSGHAYITDLGLRWPDGKYVSLFRSNMIRQPAGCVSDQVADGTEASWMSVGLKSEQESWEQMALMAIGAGSSKGSSAGGEKGDLLSLRWEFLRAVFSGSVGSWPSSMPGSHTRKKP